MHLRYLKENKRNFIPIDKMSRGESLRKEKWRIGKGREILHPSKAKSKGDILKWSTFSFALQLELITELLGTPTLEDMRFACEGARSHMLRRAPKPPSLTALYTLSSQATHEAVHLLCQMLVFDPVSFLLTSSRPPPPEDISLSFFLGGKLGDDGGASVFFFF